ncbi:hypothetical protein HK102_002029 [Quaeritorhiza haematococci]|nr:hypothetical protein HK102_002029 [Quaeritorhiza haematococci]
MAEVKRKKLAFAICEYLQQSIKNGTIKEDDAEGIEVAIQCIGEAFGVDPTSPDDQAAHSIKPATLLSIFDVFLNLKSQNKPKPEEKKKKAEELKGAGNKKMAEKKYVEAIDLYTQAIAVDGSNAVYYANRAAAYSQNNEHERAVEDSKKAIEVDPDYSKAYSRMGHAYFCMGKFEEAVDAYEQGLSLDPGNATMRQSLAAANNKLAETKPKEETAPARSAGAGMGGLPDLGGLGGLGGGGGAPGGLDFASMLSNPNFMQMASQMMSNPAVSQMLNNPAVSQMAQNLMSNPDALRNLMSNPDMARLASEMANKPSGPGL